MPSPKNRRRHVRAPAAFSGIALGERYARCVVDGLSLGGARLVGVQARLGSRIRLHVDLYGSPLLVHANVVRVEEDAIGVAFERLHPNLEERIKVAVLRALEATPMTPAVLVVDDSPGICKALRRDLHGLGYEVRTATSALEAVWHLEDAAVCVQAAIVDARMEGTSGTELLAFIAEQYPHVRRVLISGLLSGDILADAAHGARCHAYLEKPWQKRSLEAALL